ncbi:MAG TPA: ubiquinol-cytochrome c reductase iron-sulfur subunit [Candidatus Omnitrophota bacterium]|nr:ubiquinol-cytochrome c reductase iron-sulfur subunit [Candidatus Omnitrophota bacterium]
MDNNLLPEQPNQQAAATPTPGPVSTQPITRKPPEPSPAVSSNETESMDRRSFLKWLTVGWAAFAAIVAGYGSLTLRFMFPNVLFEPKQSFTAGRIDDYTVGEVSERYKEKFAVWIVRDSEKLFALSTVCTHLGCTPNWLANENKFKCPCHGSGFYKNGVNFEGPAPRPLERFKITLSDDGEIIIDKSKKFQQEKGEWNDPESYILA